MPFLRVATSLHELEKLRPYWQHLYDTGSYTRFQSYEWNRAAAEIFASHLMPYVVCCETSRGLALVPAAITSDRRLTLLGEEMFDYRDVLSSGDPEALSFAWRALEGLDLPLEIQAVPEAAVQANWHGFDVLPFASAPLVHAGATSPDQFVREHPLLARLWRKSLRAGMQLRQYDGTAADLIRYICRQQAVNHAGATLNLFGAPQRVEWVVAAAATEPTACEVFTLETAGGLAAGLITFLDFGVRRFYTICYDRLWAGLSPGNVLLLEVTRRSLELELDCDYMTGEQPYKLRLANGLMPLYRVEAPPAQFTALSARGQQYRLHAA